MMEQIIEKNGKKYKVIEIIEEPKEELFWDKYTIKNIEEAKKDRNEHIRLEAYRVLGYTEEAKKDRNWIIRKEAELYFKIKEAREKLKGDE